MGMCVRPRVRLCIVCRTHGDEKRALGPLEQELQMVVSLHVGAGSQIQVLQDQEDP